MKGVKIVVFAVAFTLAMMMGGGCHLEDVLYYGYGGYSGYGGPSYYDSYYYDAQPVCVTDWSGYCY